jgi:16S rRNA (guanine966-N2)-methyltransferase
MPPAGEVRLTGGSLRGRRVRVPATARPSSGLVREALFSIWRDELDGARFLDLYAGSGAVAFEAASRGAAGCVCVESHPASLQLLTANRDALGLGQQVQPVRATLPAGLERLQGPFDLVFADPPYELEVGETLLEALAPLLGPEGELALEHSSRRTPPAKTPSLEPAREPRRYGESSLTFYRRR